jgi:HEAT repeat protein
LEEIERILNILIQDEVAPVKDEAVKSLGKFSARRKFPEFVGVLTSGKPEDRMRVVYAAEEMGGDECLKLLMIAVEDSVDDVRGAAIRILENYPRAEVLKILVDRLPQEKGFVLGNLISVLGRSGRKELAPILTRFISHPDTEIQARTIEALGHIGTAEGLKEIIGKAVSESPSVRKAVAFALGAISLSHGS